jgi:hypothetical protein
MDCNYHVFTVPEFFEDSGRADVRVSDLTIKLAGSPATFENGTHYVEL